MKTKMKKDWYGREKSTEELHHDSKQWISEIAFIKDEMRFLEHLLSSNNIQILDIGLNEKVEGLVQRIIDEKKIGNALLRLIRKHERILSHLISSKSVAGNTNFLATHQEFEKEMGIFSTAYKKLKREIFKLAEYIKKKSSQKKILSK